MEKGKVVLGEVAEEHEAVDGGSRRGRRVGECGVDGEEEGGDRVEVGSAKDGEGGVLEGGDGEGNLAGGRGGGEAERRERVEAEKAKGMGGRLRRWC